MKQLIIVVAVIFISSCGSNSTEDKMAETDSTVTSDTVYTPMADTARTVEVVRTKGFYIWDVNMEKKTLRKNPALSAADINADSVINGLNKQYENILLEKVSISKDTIKLKIKDSDYLTNQIGSTGAAQYMAQTIINLTSVAGINYVMIVFKEGSHASPGLYMRKDFPGYIIVQ